MAKKGLQYCRWGKMASDASSAALPTYTAAKTYVVGRMVSANVTPRAASGALYGDDTVAESSSEVLGYTVETTLTEISDDAAVEIFGESVADGVISNTTADAPSYGGLGYISVEEIRGVTYFTAVFYPKCKASQPTESLNTKGDSITWGTYPVTFEAVACTMGVTRQRKRFTKDTTYTTDAAALAAAIAWLKTKMPDPVGE